ncbi:MAG: acyl-[acyl-carrier-protein] thioesterase [Eubacteriales bacterium]
MVVDEKFYIGYSDINSELALSNTAILELFENMAGIHGSLVGESLKTASTRWFLTSYHVKIKKRPEYEERINVRTWSRSVRGVSASREYEIYDESGELCIMGLSNWAHVNAVTQKLERATPELVAAYDGEPGRTNFDKIWLEKLKEPEEYSYVKDFYVDRNFIDVNNHMNNVRYLELAKLMLPEDVYAKNESREFEIMYRQAIKYGEKIKCLYAETEDAYFVTLKDEELSSVRAIIKLYK